MNNDTLNGHSSNPSLRHRPLSNWLITALFIGLGFFTQGSVAQTSYKNYAEASQTAIAHYNERQYQTFYSDTDLWSNIITEFHLPHYAQHPRVQQQVKWFTDHKQFLQRVIDHGAPYIFYIYAEVENRNLPGELILLPMIESAYDPFAHSRVGAAGLWQFMPQTAGGYGVKQDWWYDGRRDVITSTEAALTHLSDLNRMFDGNWLLAVAAYNSGAGHVQRAVARNKKVNKSTEFWELALPRETQEYVPRLLALAEIISHPEKYQVQLPKIKSEPYFAQLDIGEQIDLSHAAKMAGISLNELYLLNPGYSRWTTAPEGPHTLVLPLDKVDKFEQNFSADTGKKNIKVAFIHARKKTAPRPLPPGDSKVIYYTVRTGDALWNIAKQFNVSVGDLRAWNNLIGTNTLMVGKKLAIWQSSPGDAQHYTVSSGDSLAKIAEKFNTSVAALKKMNHLTHNTIHPGQKLAVATPTTNSTKPEKTIATADSKLVPTTPYEVKKGDSLHQIAQNHHVSVAQLMQANAMSSDTIKVGQVLHIPATKLLTVAATPATTPIEYVVQRGDSLSKIASAHNVSIAELEQWNQLRNSQIHPGQKLMINVEETA